MPPCGIVPALRNGDSDIVSPFGRSPGCSVEFGGLGCWKRRRASDGDMGVVVDAPEMSSARSLSAAFLPTLVSYF